MPPGPRTPEGLVDSLALAKAGGRSLRSAALAAKISYRHARRLAKKPGFDAKVRFYVEAIFTRAAGLYASAMVKAGVKLVGQLDVADPETVLAAAAELNRTALKLRATGPPPAAPTPPGGGIVVPLLDPRWQPVPDPNQEGGECSTPTE